MSRASDRSEEALLLTPVGRDAEIAQALLAEAGVASRIYADVEALRIGLEAGGGFALVTDEALHRSDISRVASWVNGQPPWSDFPFVLLTERGGGLERNPTAQRLTQALGNVIFLERPFHPTSLVSVARTALRARRRQYEARQRIEDIRQAEALLEARVRQRTAELADANRRLLAEIEERDRLETALRQSQRLEAVGQLTSGVAHDFNNLLTIVLGNARQLAKRAASPDAARRLAMIAQAAERGARLTAQLLAFSRRQKLDLQPVHLNDTIEAMHDLLQSSLGGQVQIATALQPGLWTAMIDPTQIELVILNLAINARDAMEGAGALSIETANVTLGPPERPEHPPAGDYVMVAVSDTGAGMSDEVLAKAFEPFFTTKPVGRGSGLGLSQVLGLAQQAGGGVRIDTAPGRGTSVKIYLPRCEPQAPLRRAPVDGPARKSGSAERVLLVDDDPAVREVTATVLSELGYRVEQAESGPAALEMLKRRQEFDLLLVDFAMPGMNGAEVARAARAERPGLPVLIVTGYADAQALSVDAVRVLQKPYTDAQLAAEVDLTLRATPRHAEMSPAP